MRIAVLSGKGGTGKTLVAVNLAEAAEKSVYVDCDVEEPNGHLFFKPDMEQEKTVTVSVPHFITQSCTGCRTCINVCQFGALAFIAQKPVLFPEVCHSCGCCFELCPTQAIREVPRPVGSVRLGHSKQVTVLSGCLEPGNTSGVPVIRELFLQLSHLSGDTVILDCPPGSACMVMESIRDADYCLLVAEPTVFGTHNLNMVYRLAQIFHKPCGVVLNKCTSGYNPSEEFCFEHNIPILERISFDRELGTINAEAKIAARELLRYRHHFEALLERIRKEVQQS